jgi:hypothetical protein
MWIKKIQFGLGICCKIYIYIYIYIVCREEINKVAKKETREMELKIKSESKSKRKSNRYLYEILSIEVHSTIV